MPHIGALHLDQYDLNMPYAWWKHGLSDMQVSFDLYFRRQPADYGFSVFAGLERIIQYVENLRFSPEDIEHLRNRPERYDEAFLQHLQQFRFRGRLAAVPEGEIVFPELPLVKVQASVLEAAIIEAALLNVVNWHTPVATKAARIRQAAGTDTLIEMATRRMPEADAAVWGARAAYIAGFDSTSNTWAEQRFGVPSKGTMGHMWIQAFPTELDAFQAFVEVFPNDAILLVDTYDTLRSGIPNAITVAKQLAFRGQQLAGIRLDSGDLAYLSIQARRMLDDAGLSHVFIVATSDLDEHVIASLREQGARIDVWGVGTALAKTAGTLGAVYKMKARGTAKAGDGMLTPVIKVSDNVEKTTIPSDIVPYRIVDNETGMARGDILCLADEPVPSDALRMFHPVHTYKTKTVENFTAHALLVDVFRNGHRVYTSPSLAETRQYHQRQLALLWPEYRRRLNPEAYPVSFSQKLWELRHRMIQQNQPEH